MSAREHSASPPLWRLLQRAAAALQGVREGRSLTALLEAVGGDERPGTQALAFQVMRWLGRAEALRDRLARRPPPAAADALLCTALALIWDVARCPYPDFTLVDQAVEAAKRQRETRAQASFINGCLRRFLRERDALVAATGQLPRALWNHPDWWVERLRADHPAHWQDILRADQELPPMTVRVHAGRVSVADYLLRLAAQGIEARQVGPVAVQLMRPVPVQALPGFADGWVSVQDAAAQRAAPLLLDALEPAARQPLRVLDACAAPGGKTAHLIEHRPDARVTALEIDPTRRARIDENLARLGLHAEVRVADAGEPAAWWSGESFDAILLDAPCSASGIARRHPDVRWLRRASDIDPLAATQTRLLHALWPTLRPGGRLLYATCSVFRQEGAERVQAFLASNTDAVSLPAPGHLLPVPVNQVPTVGDNEARGSDGFYYALLEKRLA